MKRGKKPTHKRIWIRFRKNTIKQVRVKKGIPMTLLAEAVDIDRKSLQRYESGEYPIPHDILIMIASFLQCDSLEEIVPYQRPTTPTMRRIRRPKLTPIEIYILEKTKEEQIKNLSSSVEFPDA